METRINIYSIYLLSFIFGFVSCKTAKYIKPTQAIENTEQTPKYYALDSTKSYYACLKQHKFDLPLKNIHQVAEVNKSMYAYVSAICLQEAVREEDTAAKEMYYDAIQYAYDEWMRSGQPNILIVDSLSAIKTTTSFDYLVKFLDLNTGHGSYDEVYEHDGWKVSDLVFPYLIPEQQVKYSSIRHQIYRKVKKDNFEKDHNLDRRDKDVPEAYAKFREIFLSDLMAGKIKLRNDIRNDKVK